MLVKCMSLSLTPSNRSYENSKRATEDGTLSREIVPVSVPQKKGQPDIVVTQDEEFSRYTCRPVTAPIKKWPLEGFVWFDTKLQTF